MDETSEIIKAIENQIEKVLWNVELKEKLEHALEIYQDAEPKLNELDIDANNPIFKQQQRVLSYCLMRQGNILRQLEQPQAALALGEREITAARASGDDITLACSLMSNGTNLIVSGEIDSGLKLLEEARSLFEKGKSFDHKQGSGWFWILQADLANAGLVKKVSNEVIEIATHALDILKPIENWYDLARSYAARAIAHEKFGNEEQAEKDQHDHMACKIKFKLEEENNS